MTEATQFLARALAAKASVDAALLAMDSEMARLASIVSVADRAYESAPMIKDFVNAELVRQARAGKDPTASAPVRQMRKQSEVADEHIAEMRNLYAAAREKRDEIKSLTDLAAEMVREAQVVVDEENRSPASANVLASSSSH